MDAGGMHDVGGSKGFALVDGDVVYAVEWDGDVPNLVGGRVVLRSQDAIVVEEADGRLFTSRRAIAANAAHGRPEDAVAAEMQWLKWFAPYDRLRPAEEAAGRMRRMSALEYLQRTLPCAYRFWTRPAAA